MENMRCERMLGSFRRATRHNFGRVNCKRLMSNGYMDQLTIAHRLAGGDDPRSFTRERVRGLGIQTKSTPSKSSKRVRGTTAHLQYAAAVENRNARLPRAQFLAQRKRLCAEFKGLDQETKNQYAVVKASSADDDKVSVGAQLNARYEEKIGDLLWNSSSRFEPMRPEILEQEMIRHAFGNDHGEVSLVILWRYFDFDW